MASNFELDIDVKESLPALNALLEGMKPSQLAGAMKNVGETVAGLARDTFHTSKSPYGEQWAALQESTLESLVGRGGKRRRKSYGTRPLVRTVALMNSVNWQLQLDGARVVIGVSQAYGRYHQGDPDIVGKGIVPERQFLPTAARGLPDSWSTPVVEAVESYIEAVIHEG